MFQSLLKGISVFFLILLIIGTSLITIINRQPYQSKSYYRTLTKRLDSLASNYVGNNTTEQAFIGWSEIDIPIDENQPLAGYGARNPKSLLGIHDSIFFKIFIIKKDPHKAAIISADLLIIHPEFKNAVYRSLPEGWTRDQLYFTATHTHSSIGGWAPGGVGELFAGEYSVDIINKMTSALIRALTKAEENLENGLIGYSKLAVEDLVYNRLAKDKGDVDPWFQVLSFMTAKKKAMITSYSAHPTCLGRLNREVSGDYPNSLIDQLEDDKDFDQVGFMAGPVASMGPNVQGRDGWAKVHRLASKLKAQYEFLELIGIPHDSIRSLSSFKLKLPIGDPYFKISKNLALRPYVFNYLFGNYQPEITILKINDIIMIGMPCDFSGELALPLYKKANDLDLHLIITSFNGDYLGYVIKDKWYDLNKYESRTMSWYGPDMGAYMSEVSSRLIQIMHEN
ncbi:MAG: neutral ceramidase [Cyclobacteriaceae bacterium]|jgi:neutral ceramidase